jgi:hypothetical protein
MINLTQASAVATARWSDLARELDDWAEEGRIATLWWRDDDAAAPCGRLDRLLEIAADVPVALAVIPAEAELSLAARLGDRGASSTDGPAVGVLQHGWRHADHAAPAKKSEYPADRPPAVVRAELRAGRARLRALFGSGALAVLAPPWNRFADAMLPLLAECRIAAISRFGPRRAVWPAPAVFEANVHVDPVCWKGDRGFVGDGVALGALVRHLRTRRAGVADPDEPTGILTHHLIQDEATGGFLARLVALTAAHPAARWLAGSEVFAPALGRAAAAEAASGAPP